MDDLLDKIESNQAELDALRAMLAQLVEMAPDHFDRTEIEAAMRKQIAILDRYIGGLLQDYDEYQAQLRWEDSIEYNKYVND